VRRASHYRGTYGDLTILQCGLRCHPPGHGDDRPPMNVSGASSASPPAVSLLALEIPEDPGALGAYTVDPTTRRARCLKAVAPADRRDS